MALSVQKEKDIAAQYDPIRKRAQQQEAANLQTQREQLTRNAARLGGGPSGAFIKQDQIAGNQSAERLQTANEAIDAQHTAALNQARDVQEGRDFQTSERVGSQTFAGQQADIQRKYQTGERLGTQAYQTGERESSQGFVSGQSALDRAMQKYGIDTNKSLQEASLTGKYNGKDTLAGKTFKSAQDQQDFENKHNVNTNILTSYVSLKNSGVPDDRIKALFAELGFDRLGFDINKIIAAPPVAAPVKPSPVKGSMGPSAPAYENLYDHNGVPIRPER